MPLPQYLHARTLRWVAEQSTSEAEMLDEYIAELAPDERHDFELLSSHAKNKAASFCGAAITVEMRGRHD